MIKTTANPYDLCCILGFLPYTVPDTIDPFGFYNMDEHADYPPPIKGRRYQIRESAITSMTQTVCYDQTIYTDDRNETDEYFSLTLTIQENSDPRTVVDAVLGSTIFKIMNNGRLLCS